MTIDIISYTEEQYAELSAEQLLKVQEAQNRKERLEMRLEEDIQKAKEKLVKNGVFNSGIFNLLQAKLQEEYEREVDLIRDGLLFYLRYSMRPAEAGTEDAPYTVNYALSDLERYTIVKEYYETTYTDGKERFEAFKADKVAPSYLGELYAPLYDYFLEFA